MIWCHQIDHTKPQLNNELYTFYCTGRQSSQQQDNCPKSVLSGSLLVAILLNVSMFLFKMLIFNSKMHRIAQICTDCIFSQISWRGYSQSPKTGEGISPLPLGVRPPSHLFRGSAAAGPVSNIISTACNDLRCLNINCFVHLWQIRMNFTCYSNY